ncbi:NAD(P)-binding protein [Pholiota molesta]|nr:NAD(P)-binding protein [Pholiota molesta]
MSGQIYFIAGASRGIGLALVDAIASKDHSAIIYAGVRDPSRAGGASQLKELVPKYPGRIEIVKYVAGDKEGNEAIATEIKAKYGRVDTVIANAAIANYIGKVHETPGDEFQEHFAVNVLGPIVLFQSIRDVLKASALPRFVPISSGAGSVAAIQPGGMDIAVYGTSKAALNWVTRKIHFENEWLIAFPQCPGPVETDMAKPILDKEDSNSQRMRSMMRQPNAAAGILVDLISTSTREKDGGQFHNIDGGRHRW